MMAEFESENKKTQIPDDLLARVKDVVLDSVKVENTEMLEIMKKVFNDNGGQYCICPHTAVGAAYHYKNPSGTNQVFNGNTYEYDAMMAMGMKFIFFRLFWQPHLRTNSRKL